MSNLLKTDFYRLFRSKSFYICGFIAFALFDLGLILIYLLSNMAAVNGAEISVAKSGIEFGLNAFPDMDSQIILSIIIGIFITSEFSHGTMKNVVSKGFSRIQIYFSKLITMIAATYMIILVTFLTGTIGASIITGKIGDFSSNSIAKYARTIGIELLLYAALTALLVAVGMLIRNLGGVIAINIVGIIIFIPIILNILQAISNDKIKFMDFTLMSNMSLYVVNAEPAAYLRTFIVALAYFAVPTALGVFAFVKADVK